ALCLSKSPSTTLIMRARWANDVYQIKPLKASLPFRKPERERERERKESKRENERGGRERGGEVGRGWKQRSSVGCGQSNGCSLTRCSRTLPFTSLLLQGHYSWHLREGHG